MKIAIVGDLHLHESYLDRCKLVLNEIVKVVNELKPQLFVFLGDLFESKDRIPNVLYELVDEFVFNLNVPEKVFILGNHDISHDSITAPFLNRITVRVTDREVIETRSSNLIFIAYRRDYTEFRKVLNELTLNKENSIVFCHNQLLPFSRNFYSDESNVIDILNVNNVRFAFAGHIHQFSSHNDQYFHVGSVFQRDFRDSFFESERLFHGILLFNNGKVKKIDFIDRLPELPVYITIRRRIVNTRNKLVNTITEISDLFPQNPVNLMINIPKGLSASYVEEIVRDKIKNVDKLFIDEEIEFDEASSVLEVNRLFDLEQMLQEYVASKKPENKDEIISVGLELIRVCRR